jgi:predicted aconitase with swiveling domain
VGETFVLRGRRVVPGKAAGEAVVCREAISFNGGVDNLTGIVSEEGHSLQGMSVTGKVLVYTTGKGSTGGSYKIYDMVVRGTAPVALVQLKAETVTTIGAIMGDMPIVDSLDRDPTVAIATGDYLVVDADAGTVTVTKANS